VNAILGLLGPLAWRNLWRNPRRTLFTLAVVVVGVWSILLFDVAIKAVAENGKQQSLRLLTGEGQIHAAGYLDDPNIDHRMPAPTGRLGAVLTGPAVLAWAPRVRVPAVIESEYRTRAVTFLGVAPGAEAKVSDLPGQILAGRYLRAPGDDGLVIGADMARRLKTRLGKRVILMTQGADGRLAEAGFTVVGLFGNVRPAQDEFVFTGLARAQALLGLGGDLSEISFDAANRRDPAPATRALAEAAPNLEVDTWMSLSPLAFTIESLSSAYVAVWLTIMFVLMAIGIVNTQLMAVFERRREFGLIQALGLRPAQIVLLVTLESGLLMGVGVALGVMAGYATVLPLGGHLDMGPFAGAMERYGFGGVLRPTLDLGDAAAVGVIVWSLGLVAALWPAASAARASPILAMSEA